MKSTYNQPFSKLARQCSGGDLSGARGVENAATVFQKRNTVIAMRRFFAEPQMIQFHFVTFFLKGASINLLARRESTLLRRNHASSQYPT